MVTFPFCKINLGLRILSKRADGYHDIETCFYPVPWSDILEILPSTELTFNSSGLPVPGNEEENLCLRAYRLIGEDIQLPPVAIYLHKILPIGAGLGGGSSDAAHTILCLNEELELGLTLVQMKAYCSRLGSDCSFFVEGKPQIGKGRGELLTPSNVSLAGKHILLVAPEIHISTSDAYASVVPQSGSLVDEVLRGPIQEWGHLVNDFEPYIFQKYPALRQIKLQLLEMGALYASMSGSGSALYGIFDHPPLNPFVGMTHWSGVLK